MIKKDAKHPIEVHIVNMTENISKIKIWQKIIPNIEKTCYAPSKNHQKYKKSGQY